MGLRSTLRRTDWLAEMQAVLVIAIVLVTAGVLVAAGRAMFADSVTVTVPAGSIDGLAAAGGSLRSNAAVDLDGEVDVAIAGPSAGQRAISLLTHLPSSLVGLALVVLLWRIVRTGRRTTPFAAALPGRLSRLGAVALAGGLVAEMVQLSATFVASGSVFDGFWSASYRYSWWWLLVGFGFLAVAEVVKRGAALRAELDHVV